MTTFRTGQELVLQRRHTAYPIGGGSYYERSLKKGTTVVVTRVTQEGAWLRGWAENGFQFTLPYYGTPEDDIFQPVDPNAPKPRKLGDKPEGDDYLDSNDPRIQWIFDDMGAYATNSSYCSTYDKLMGELGLPGRPKDFTITEDINGFTVSKKYKARSKKEAQALFDAEKVGVVK